MKVILTCRFKIEPNPGKQLGFENFRPLLTWHQITAPGMLYYRFWDGNVVYDVFSLSRISMQGSSTYCSEKIIDMEEQTTTLLCRISMLCCRSMVLGADPLL